MNILLESSSEPECEVNPGSELFSKGEESSLSLGSRSGRLSRETVEASETTSRAGLDSISSCICSLSSCRGIAISLIDWII
jgi:hypothetical protein